MEAAKQFSTKIGDGKIVAVTGGSTIAAIPSHIEKFSDTTDQFFIAARGGVGDDIGLQANVIAASFAEACGGTYSTFYYPESLSEEAQKAFRNEPFVVKMLGLYETTDCVLHGIGDAQTMAVLRNSPKKSSNCFKRVELSVRHSVTISIKMAMSFIGLRTVGIQTSHLERIPLIISVAGGRSKAEAIMAYMASAPKQTFW